MPSPERTTSALINRAVLQDLARQYFATVHYYGFYTFVHPSHFSALLDRDRAPKELSLVIGASAVRFGTSKPSAEALVNADGWMDAALSGLLLRVHQGFGAVHLMAVVLASQYESARGNHTSAWILVGNAVRMMQMLRLHTFDDSYPTTSPASPPPLFQPEAMRRLAWSVFVLDTVADGGKFGHHVLTEDVFEIMLPCDEGAFIRDTPVRMPVLNTSAGDPAPGPGSAELSLSAQLIRTYAMRRRILHFASRVGRTRATSAELQTSIQRLQGDMDALVASLSPSLAYSDSQYYALSNQIVAFVLLHTLQYNCYIILLRAKLLVATRDPELEYLIPEYRNDRIARALPVARIIADGMKHRINFDPTIGVQAYVALEILLFEPIRLVQRGIPFDTKAASITAAIRSLLGLIRQLSAMTAAMAGLHVEACYRMIRCGFADLLVEEDWEAFRMEYPFVGQDVAEYDFRDFRWQKQERYRRTGRLTMTAADALVDLGIGTGAITAPPSRPSSPHGHLPADVAPSMLPHHFDPTSQLLTGAGLSASQPMQPTVLAFPPSPAPAPTLSPLNLLQTDSNLNAGDGAASPTGDGLVVGSYQQPVVNDELWFLMEPAAYGGSTELDPFDLWISDGAGQMA